jgi:hypothetical protein
MLAETEQIKHAAIAPAPGGEHAVSISRVEATRAQATSIKYSKYGRRLVSSAEKIQKCKARPLEGS